MIVQHATHSAFNISGLNEHQIQRWAMRTLNPHTRGKASLFRPGFGQRAANIAAFTTFMSIYPAYEAYKGVRGVFRQFSQIDRRMRRLETGGNYQDTQTNQQLRLGAIQDIAGAFQSSRRFLGREAEIMHNL